MMKKIRFFSFSGVIIPRENLRRNIKRYIILANVQEIRLHDLRHSIHCYG